ncbi:MAG: hypothetical protein KatS3mg111_3233 [Pirellulaceae bacterium]|nr:MAG: hypothetical protein KatS3mg111_3233 [Pirellulaceae bacterium]
MRWLAGTLGVVFTFTPAALWGQSGDSVWLRLGRWAGVGYSHHGYQAYPAGSVCGGSCGCSTRPIAETNSSAAPFRSLQWVPPASPPGSSAPHLAPVLPPVASDTDRGAAKHYQPPRRTSDTLRPTSAPPTSAPRAVSMPPATAPSPTQATAPEGQQEGEPQRGTSSSTGETQTLPVPDRGLTQPVPETAASGAPIAPAPSPSPTAPLAAPPSSSLPGPGTSSSRPSTATAVVPTPSKTAVDSPGGDDELLKLKTGDPELDRLLGL